MFSAILAALLAVPLALVMGCFGASPESPVASYPPPIRRACAVMAKRCSKCHSPDRVNAVQVSDPRGWELIVRRMRLQPSSGISPADEERVVRCIVYRKFGFDNARERKGGST